MLETLLQDAEYAFVGPEDKAFIVAFDKEMARLGYTSGGAIGEGYCWGRKMIIYDCSANKDFPSLSLS